MSRPSAGKRDLERAKKARAEQKRARRLDRSAEPGDTGDPAEGAPAGPGPDPARLLEDLERNQAAFDAHEISFDEYEERRTALLAAITVD